MNDYDRLVGPEELTAYIGVNNAQAVMRLMRKGVIPAKKIAGKWRTKYAWVDDAIRREVSKR
jgi:hypothetical protein